MTFETPRKRQFRRYTVPETSDISDKDFVASFGSWDFDAMRSSDFQCLTTTLQGLDMRLRLCPNFKLTLLDLPCCSKPNSLKNGQYNLPSMQLLFLVLEMHWGEVLGALCWLIMLFTITMVSGLRLILKKVLTTVNLATWFMPLKMQPEKDF